MPWMLVASNTTSVAFFPAGPWVSVTGVTASKGWGELRGHNGNLVATPALQLTNDVHAPSGTGTAAGAQLTTNGVSDPNGDQALSSGSYRFGRPGWNVALSSGSVLATALVGGTIELIRG